MLERFADAGDLTGPGQPIGQVPAAERGAREGAAERGQVDGQAELFQPLGHGREAIHSRRAEARGRGDDGGVVVADEMAEDVDLAPIKLGRPLDPGNKLDSQPHRLGPGDGQSRDCVMVGDRNRRQPDVRRRRHDFARRANSVGVRRVDVQVGPERGLRLAGRARDAAELSHGAELTRCRFSRDHRGWALGRGGKREEGRGKKRQDKTTRKNGPISRPLPSALLPLRLSYPPTCG
jgi:hypothetical protein